MSHGKAIVKNAAWLMGAQAAQKAIAFLTFTVVARLVGVAVTGKFFFAVSVTSVFVILTDLGLTPVVIREMAADEDKGRSVLAQALRAKFFLIPLAIVCSLLYAWLAKVEPEIFLGVAVACLVMSADALSLLWYGAIRGRRRLEFEAVGMFLTQVVTAVVSLVVAWRHGGVVGLAFGLFCGSAWNLIWSVWQANKLKLTPQKTGGWTMRHLLRAALPFALAGIFVKVYSYTDTLLLKQFHDAVAVGYYAVAYKVTYAFQFLPLAFVAALYPSMSAAYASKERAALSRILSGSLRLMMILSVPITACLSALAYRLVPLIYGQAYLGSIAPLTILPWVLIPIFLDFPVGSLLNATHRAEQKTMAMGLAMVVNVTANILLVPSLGPTGAAWAGVVSFWLLFFAGAWFARRDFQSAGWAASLFFRGLMAAATIWILSTMATPHLPLWVALVFSAALAITAMFAFRLLTWQDVMMVISWAKRRAEPPDVVEEELHEQV